MKSLIRVVVLTLALISAGHASAVFANDAWEIVTPASTSGYSFTSISAMDNYVYLGTNHGVYRSTNRGTTWSQINSGLGNQTVRAMAIGVIFDGSNYAINSGTAVFAATAGGVFKTTIGSTAWSAVNNGLTSIDIKDIQFDQLLATAGTDTTIYVATPAGVFRSDDAGDNWLLVDSGMSGQSVTKIMTDFVTGNIYAVTSSNEIYASSMFSFSGVDESWSLAYSGSNIRDISLLNPLGAISWLATDAGVLKSDENGINWSLVNSGNSSGRVNVMMSDYLDMNVTYAGSNNGGVYRTINEALDAPAWTQISTSLSDTAITDIATNPATSLVVYATGANGVYRLELTDAYADVSTTPVVPTDTANPTITISAPANNATVSGNTTVSANASDNIGVAGVQFKLDGVNLGAEDTTAPYSFLWNTASTSNGNHTLTAVARDAAGNTATASTVSVTVNNVVVDTTAPSVPTNFSATVVSANQVNLTWTASTDAVGVTGYRVMRRNGSGAYSTIGTTAMTTYTDTAVSSLTTYTYRVAAFDAASNTSGNATSLTVTTLPAAPANLSASVVSTSQINLTWTVSSEAVSGYEVYRDNNLIATVTHPTASYSDISLVAGTTYTYTTKSVSATSSVKSVFSNSISAKTQAKASSGGGGGGGGGGSASTRGCTDPKATNYSAKAKKDNGTCKYTVVKSPIVGSSVVVNNSTYTTGYVFTTVMGLGSKGTDIIELQKIMVSLGYLTEAPTGYFGVLTEQAVKKFQISKGLEAVGSVGPQTRIALNQITAKAPIAKSKEQLIKELMALVQELTKKLMLMKAAEAR